MHFYCGIWKGEIKLNCHNDAFRHLSIIMRYSTQCLYLCLIFSLTLISAHVYLSPKGKDNPNCTIQQPCLTLQHAIQLSNTNDEIILLPGVYKQCSTVHISKSVFLRNHKSSTAVLYQGDCFQREAFLFNVTMSSVHVDGITFQNFDRVFMVSDSNSVILRNVIFTQCGQVISWSEQEQSIRMVELTLQNCTLVNSGDSDFENVFDLTNVDFNLINSNVTNNWGNVTVFNFNNVNAEITNTTIDRNRVRNLLVSHTFTIEDIFMRIRDCSFTQNTVESLITANGYRGEDSFFVDIVSTTISNNQFQMGILATRSNLSMIDTQFIENVRIGEDSSRAAVRALYANFELTGCNFLHNYNFMNTVELLDHYHDETSEMHEFRISGCRFYNNSNLLGSTVKLENGHFIVDETIFENNVAHLGGGLYIISARSFSCLSCSFIGNKASYGGGLLIRGNQVYANMIFGAE
jgi:hypothetical protein